MPFGGTMAKKKAKTIKCPHCGLSGKKPGHPAHCLMKPSGDGEQEKPPDEGAQSNEGVMAETAMASSAATMEIAAGAVQGEGKTDDRQTVASEPVVEQKPPEPAPAPSGPVKMCHKCGRHPVKQLNVVDWHCPSCGDYELKVVRK